MKNYLTILTLFFCQIIHSQEKKLVWTEKTCQSGIEKAQKDFNEGYYYLESFGLLALEDIEFWKFYKNYLLEKYMIISTNSCVVTDYKECYSKKIKKLLFEKYGTDIF